jgi:hypothetical protein
MLAIGGLDLIMVLLLGVFWNEPSSLNFGTEDLILHTLLAAIVVYWVYFLVREAIRTLTTTGRQRDMRGGTPRKC